MFSDIIINFNVYKLSKLDREFNMNILNIHRHSCVPNKLECLV